MPSASVMGQGTNRGPLTQAGRSAAAIGLWDERYRRVAAIYSGV